VSDVPGQVMSGEMGEQPSVLSDILDRQSAVRDLAERIRRYDPRFVLLVARGSSDNAALYAKYLFEVLLGLPAGLASPSSITTYHAQPSLAGVLFVAVSQSGFSPDLVDSTVAAGAAGAMTLAVTNDTTSPLAGMSQLVFDIGAGNEAAIAATKTYTAELLSLYLIVDSLRDGKGDAAREIPEAVVDALEQGPTVELLVPDLSETNIVLTTARGYSYATACEAALKLIETACLPTLSYSGADLLHGPVALLAPGMTVLGVVPEGQGAAAILPVLDRCRELGACVRTVGSSRSDAIDIRVTPVAEEVAPVVEVVPFQLLAQRTAVAKGLDPDAPRGLTKVTLTT
jgi:glutamine---fructose-6-phosphate transaminase (isomerizing)